MKQLVSLLTIDWWILLQYVYRKVPSSSNRFPWRLPQNTQVTPISLESEEEGQVGYTRVYFLGHLWSRTAQRIVTLDRSTRQSHYGQKDISKSEVMVNSWIQMNGYCENEQNMGHLFWPQNMTLQSKKEKPHTGFFFCAHINKLFS